MKPLRNIVYVKPYKPRLGKGILEYADTGHIETSAPFEGEVKFCGEDCQQVKVGDKVHFPKGTGLKQDIDGELLLVMDEDHIEFIY